MRKFYFLAILVVCGFASFSQNIGINSTGALPDSSAILDVKSINKGLLLPRMTDSQRIAIHRPATGLVVYQTNGTTGFYFNSGSPTTPKWVLLAKENLLPVVNPGKDNFLTLTGGADSIQLKGTATDNDGSVKSYSWTQVSGPKPTIIHNPGSDTTYVNSFVAGKYVFQLAATDNMGATAVKSVSITVFPAGSLQLTTGLVAHYPFNNNTNDSSGNNNNGALIAGATLGTDKNGRTASALDCNGNGQLLLVNNNGKIVFDTAMTVSFDVMIRNYGRHHFVNMVDYGTSLGANFKLGTVISGDSDLIASVVNKNVNCNNYRDANDTYSVDSKFRLQPQTWYNVIFTFNKGKIEVYIDGVLIASGTSPYSSILNCPQAELIIGGWWQQDPTASLNGKIDNVRLYDRKINSAEIAELSKDSGSTGY